MTAARVEGIRAALAQARYRNVFAQIRRRAEAAGLDAVKRVRFVDLTAEERSALEGLIGRMLPTRGPCIVPVDELDRALRESSLAVTLEDVLVALGDGRPLGNRRQARVAKSLARDVVFARARHNNALGRVELEGFVDEVRRDGLVARAARRFGGDESLVLDRAVAAVAALPADGVLLPVFAATVTGDAHAFDAGRLLGTIVLRAAQRLARWPTPPANADERRRLWAAVGVECDALSADLVALRVPLLGDDALSARVRAANVAGDPIRLTLWDIDRYGVTPGELHELYVVENPAVASASAKRSGAVGPAIVCVEGMPSTAAWRFLSAFARAGVELRFHVDFDWGGIRIGNLLVERLGAKPWRMSNADYVRALTTVDEVIPLLRETSDAAVWDAQLAPTLAEHGAAIFEEQLLEGLLEAWQE